MAGSVNGFALIEPRSNGDYAVRVGDRLVGVAFREGDRWSVQLPAPAPLSCRKLPLPRLSDLFVGPFGDVGRALSYLVSLGRQP